MQDSAFIKTRKNPKDFLCARKKQSVFLSTFGNTPKIKVFDFLLDNRTLDWSKSDIAEQAGISRATLDNFFDCLVKDKIIIQNRNIGRATLFKLNLELPLIQKLIELDVFLSKGEILEKTV